MKKLGNVLYVMTPDSYLFCENNAIAVRIGGVEKARIPAHTIESIVCFGIMTVTTPLIRFCGDMGIGLSFCSEYGRFYGRIQGPVSGNVLLRKRQYLLADKPEGKSIVKNILYGKIANSKLLILRAAREHPAVGEYLRSQADKLTNCANLIKSADSIDTMRGIEGVAGAAYFGAFEAMQIVSSEEMMFEKRTRHPPENRMNALLSFLYMLCKNDVQSALETVGLDPASGFLHTLRPGRPSLALDLMEELRAPLCDRIALSLTNLKQIQSDDFSVDNGKFKLSDSARKKVIETYQNRKKTEILHPFLKEKIPVGLIPYTQGMLLARHIRGDLDAYPPFLWR